MRVLLNSSIPATVTPDPLEYRPRFSPSVPQVAIGPYRNADDRENAISETFGSMQWLWSDDDDFRFRNTDRVMCGLVLHVPEIAEDSPERSEKWQHVPVTTGGLRAEKSARFALPQATTRWTDSDSGQLVCLHGDATQPEDKAFRLRVAPDAYLLFQNDLLAGWALEDPANYLTSSWEQPDTTRPSPTTRSLLAECLALTSEPLVEDVMDQEAEAWRRLRKVLDALHSQTSDETRFAILENIMNDLVEMYS